MSKFIQRAVPPLPLMSARRAGPDDAANDATSRDGDGDGGVVAPLSGRTPERHLVLQFGGGGSYDADAPLGGGRGPSAVTAASATPRTAHPLPSATTGTPRGAHGSIAALLSARRGADDGAASAGGGFDFLVRLLPAGSSPLGWATSGSTEGSMVT